MYLNAHAIGDSHVLHMGGQFVVHHICDSDLQGATAHNLIEDKSSTDSKRKLAAILDSLDPKRDTVILSFGEVDCRLHIRNPQMALDTASRYTDAVQSVIDRGFRTVVCAVIGAVPQDNSHRVKDYQSAEVRGGNVMVFNAAVKAWCESNGAEFLDLGVSTTGVLNPALTDDGVHLNADAERLYGEWAKSAHLGMEALNVVWCLGALETHGRTVADALGWPLFVECPLGDGIDIAYIIGMYDAPDYDFTLDNTNRAKRRVIQWCGSDVQALSRPEMLPDCLHLCETEGIRGELKEHGIEAKLVMFPTKAHPEVVPLPDEEAVSFYAGSDPEKYGASMVRFLMDAMPDVKWHVYQLGQYDTPTMESLIAQSRVYVRFTRHDGGAGSAREFMEGGRRVVATCDLPHVKHVSLNDPSAIVRVLRKALRESEPDTEAAAYYAQHNSVDRFLADFKGALDASN